jgi:hypothetical protein
MNIFIRALALVIFSAAFALMLAGCGGGEHDDGCGGLNAERISLTPGAGPQHIARSIEVPARAAPWTMRVQFDANRRIESHSGVDLGPPGVAASYYFVRLYRNGVFWRQALSDAVQDLSLPVQPGTCAATRQHADVSVEVPAGDVVRVEVVWALVKPRTTAQDVTAVTETFELRAQ